jgi:hypothetical protein
MNSAFYEFININASVKTHQQPLFVIPAKTGIQESRLWGWTGRGSDGLEGFLRGRQY